MSYLSEYLEKRDKGSSKDPKLLEFFKEFTEIIESKELDWEEKFDLGFGLRRDRYPYLEFNYCDPDTTFEEDIMAFYNAVKERGQKL